MKKVLKIGCLSIIGIVVLLGVLVVIGGKSTTTTSTTQQQAVSIPKPQEQPTGAANAAQSTSALEPTRESEPTNAPQTTAEPQPTAAPTVGLDLRVGDVRWKVLSAENLGNILKSKNQFVKDLKTSGFFVQVRFEVENLSNDSLTYAGSAQLKDDQGRKFEHSSDALFFIPEEEQAFLTNLNPNITKTLTEIYEVPANAKGIKFYVGGLKFLGNDEAAKHHKV